MISDIVLVSVLVVVAIGLAAIWATTGDRPGYLAQRRLASLRDDLNGKDR